MLRVTAVYLLSRQSSQILFFLPPVIRVYIWDVICFYLSGYDVLIGSNLVLLFELPCVCLVERFCGLGGGCCSLGGVVRSPVCSQRFIS